MPYSPSLPAPVIQVLRTDEQTRDTTLAVVRIGNTYVQVPAALDAISIGRKDGGTGQPDQVIAVLRGETVVLASWDAKGAEVDVDAVRQWVWTLVVYLLDPTVDLEQFPALIRTSGGADEPV